MKTHESCVESNSVQAKLDRHEKIYEAAYPYEKFYEDCCVTLLDWCAQMVITFTKFLKLDVVEEMLGDEKKRELMLIAMVARDRLFARAYAHVVQSPAMREALLGAGRGVDFDASIATEGSPLMAP
eukprot:COSAG06_NODE_26113_length_621_cov_1.057471_1_plen_126_part_00